MPVAYTNWEPEAASNGSGSPPYRYAAGSFRGADVNDSLQAIGAAIRSLGDVAAKLPLNEDGSVNNGPDSGRLGTAAFLDTDEISPTSGTLYNKTRVVAAKDIRLFYGTLAEAATEAAYGWAICDGRTQNSIVTPDLRGRFPMFYSATDAPKATGGATSRTSSSNGAHTHSGSTTGGTALTVSQTPVQFSTRQVESGSDVTIKEAESKTASTHNHSVSIASDGAHTHTVSDVRPSWVAIIPLLWVGT
jgi:hypothetical protein